MAETTAEKKHITIGILAHVDTGKTTLSEELLYETGVRKQAGPVSYTHLTLPTTSRV